MPAPIILKIDVTKLNKSWLFRSTKGTAVYADLVLYENDEPDQYGNTHAIKQNPPKEAREAGEKGHYVGNGKFMGDRKPRGDGGGWSRQQAPAKSAARPQETEDEDIPF